ncbi:RNA polymerase sigma factor [bacterium]|jgi:RNA polymerase sigma-70 factor (ECF subfamily)|nr:RNA polymerase sigma factor [bacterium]
MSIFGKNLKDMYPDIRRVAMKLTKYNEADADDLVQKSLLKAFEKQDLFKGGNLTGWVVTIMKNLFIDDMRKLKDKIFVDIEDEILTSNSNDKHLDVADTNSALKKLGKKCQNILSLIAEEYKYVEISECLSIPIGTVMSSLTRCRKQLYKELYG